MRTLVIDGGGRGQAIGHKLASEGHEVFMSPGSPGNEDFAVSTDIPTDEIARQVGFARRNKIDLSVATEDMTLAAGIGDVFAEEGRLFFGPTQAQSRIEWDREWAKDLGDQYKIPMGPRASFFSADQAIKHADQATWPLYLKQNGLAKGKGATRCDNIEEFTSTVRQLEAEGLVSLQKPVVVEEYVEGPECSHHAFCDGLNYLPIPFVVEDHKTIGEGDTGLMTGGMGVVGPITDYEPNALEIGETFVAPIVHSLGFRGVLFAGLKGGKALEWNARPGDPEFQLFLQMMKSDLMPVLMACVKGELDKLKQPPEWELNKFGANLVLAADGYPGKPLTGQVIEGLDEVAKMRDIRVFHAATQRNGTNILTNGGRVLNLVALADTQKAALQKVYKAAQLILFGGQPPVYRKDIGQRRTT